MRAVWSFWTKPLSSGYGLPWLSEKHHLLAWVLSVETARRHYPITSLFTDDGGARILVDGVGLEFDHVSTELNALSKHDPQWWVLGKLYAYRSQIVPFIHLDTDVFLWKRLPERMESAPVFAQSFECFTPGEHSWYIPDRIEFTIRGVDGWIPEELERYIPDDGVYKAVCCGIVGGNRVDFIRYYADSAIRFVEHPRNQAGWSRLGQANCVTLEQFFLGACIEYHRNRPGSPFKDIDIQCLFSSTSEAFNPNLAAEAGYTHLIGGAKKDHRALGYLEARVQRDYPEHYERCIRYISNLENRH